MVGELINCLFVVFFYTLQLYTFIDVFMGSILSYYKFKEINNHTKFCTLDL